MIFFFFSVFFFAQIRKTITKHKHTQKTKTKKNGEMYLETQVDKLDWESDYHFFDSKNEELTVQYILILDCLNFCFWPLPKFEYQHLARGLRDTLKSNPKAFDANNLLNVTQNDIKIWLKNPFGDNIPLIEERVR